jgi:superfamily II DNA helicase RecQ
MRESTDRPNLGYHVLRCKEFVADTNEVVVKLARVLEEDFESDSRGIIFCRSISRVQLLAPQFQDCMSHSKMSAEDRMAGFEKWRCGSAKWIVATTGLLHGIDYGWVDAVIFLEMPYGLMNFVQGAGRAGRKGQPSHIFLLHSSNQSQIMPQGSEPDQNCIIGGIEYMKNTTECRRFIVTRIMDGEGVRCREVFNALPCDICEPKSKLAVASKALVVAKGKAPQRVHDDVSLNSSSLYHSSSMLTSGGQMKPSGGQGANRSSSSSLETGNTNHRSTTTMSSSGGQSGSRSHVTQGEQQQQRQAAGHEQSMAILMDAEYARNQTLTLKSKVELLARMTEAVRGHCPVCWAWKKRLTKRTAEHKPFTSCVDQGEWVEYAYGWLDFKRGIRAKFPKYEYCYNCGLPQGKNLPTSHPAFEQGTQVASCPLNDFGALVLWHIFHHVETWEAACMQFAELGGIATVVELTSWATQKKGQDKFWNGLELILWFMDQREKGTM